MDCKLTRDSKEMSKWASSPRYIGFRQISQDLCAVFLKRKMVYMRQAWAIGVTILERSKGLVYDHYYNRIKPALDGEVSVAMTDTDSLLLMYTGTLDRDGIYDRLRPLLDLSNFPSDHPRHDASRMNQLTFWKDEMKGDEIAAFAGVSSKSYAVDVDVMDRQGNNRLRGREETKCKGVARGVRKTVPFHKWKDAVLHRTEHRVMQYTIVSENHQIHTLRMNRLAVSPFDDKR